MKIGIQTWGSDGDIRPFTALAGGLAEAGHTVTLVVTSVDGKNYDDLASAMDFTLRHVPEEPSYAEESIKAILIGVERTGNIIQQFKLLVDHTLDPVTDEMYDAAKKLCDENDLVIGHVIVHPLLAASQLANIPYALVTLAPLNFPSRFAPPAGLPDLPKFFYPVLWKAAGFGLDLMLKKSVNRLRKKLELPLINHILADVWRSDILNLIAVSPTICETQPDWDSTVHVSGFFNVPAKAEKWKPPTDLQKFLDDGEPPVYMTFGSFNQMDIDGNIKLLAEAARLSGKRAIIQSHWDRAKFIPDAESIYKIDKAPHHKIFPHCAALVHHGGAGTTQSSVYCGLPSVVVAHAFDQPFWASELRRNGIGAKTLHKRRVTPQKIADQIIAVTSTPSMKTKACAMSASLKKENGVARAVELIEKTFNA